MKALNGFKPRPLILMIHHVSKQDIITESKEILTCSSATVTNCPQHIRNTLFDLCLTGACGRHTGKRNQMCGRVRVVFSCLPMAEGKMWTDGNGWCACLFLHSSHPEILFSLLKACCVYSSGVKVLHNSSKQIWIIQTILLLCF